MQILNNDTDVVLNRQQVMYLHAKGKVEKALKENLSRHPTTAESTIKFLRSIEGSKFYCLYHRVDSRLHSETTKGRPKTNIPPQQKEVTNMGYYFEYEDSDGKIIVDHVEFASNFQRDLEQFTNVHRESLRIVDTQKMLIACAWVLPHEIKKFALFPECLFADVTAGTNKERRPFFHLCGKDNHNEVFTILRAWLPSECAWVFHWINNKVLVSFYPQMLLNKIRIYITDGDPEEISQTDSFIQTNARNCIRVRCGWHITYKNLVDNKHCPPFKDSTNGKNIQKLFLGWLYRGLISGGAENKLEFDMSLSLLRRWIQSEQIVDIIGVPVSQFWLDWIEQHLLPHKQYIAFYVRFRIHHFDECSNSANESMNRSLKYSCIKVDGNTRLDDSTMKISSNAL